MNTAPSIYKSLFFLWIAHFFMDFFTGIWPIYKTLAQIDVAKAGLIVGISGFAGEILQLYSGYLCDRGHRKKMLILGLVLASAILWVTFTHEIMPCFMLLLLLMIGSGAFHPAAAGMASILSPQKGRMVLIFASGGAIGLGVSQIAFTQLMNVFEGHAWIALVPLAIVLFSLFLHPFPKQETAVTAVPLKDFFKPLMQYRRPLFLLYISQVSTQALYMSIMFLLPDLLRANACHSWLCMGGGHLCFVLAAAVTMIPAGYLCDKYGQKSVLLFVVSAAICLYYLFLGKPGLSFGATLALMAALGGVIGIINPIIVSWGNRLVPESPSTVSALLMGFAWCVGNLGPTASGLITQFFPENPFPQTLSIMGALLFLILFCIILMPRPEKSFANIPND